MAVGSHLINVARPSASDCRPRDTWCAKLPPVHRTASSNWANTAAMPADAKSGWKTWQSRLGWRRWEAGPRNVAAPLEPQRGCAVEFAPEDQGSAHIHCCKTGDMRPGQSKRSRGRNGGGGGGGGGGGSGGGPHHNNRPRPPHRQQTFDSNGPS